MYFLQQEHHIHIELLGNCRVTFSEKVPGIYDLPDILFLFFLSYFTFETTSCILWSSTFPFAKSF